MLKPILKTDDLMRLIRMNYKASVFNDMMRKVVDAEVHMAKAGLIEKDALYIGCDAVCAMLLAAATVASAMIECQTKKVVDTIELTNLLIAKINEAA